MNEATGDSKLNDHPVLVNETLVFSSTLEHLSQSGSDKITSR